jgi:sugar fermentation stimulation protein A
MASTYYLVKLSDVYPCTIVQRVNRFTVLARVGESLERVYNTNTGRLEGVLVPGAHGFCTVSRGRLRYRLVAVEYGGGYAVVDTRLQEEAFEAAVGVGAIEWLRGCRVEARGVRVGRSVLDYLLDCGGEKAIVELKSAILLSPWREALYPDCPTERGRRHVEELARLARQGLRAVLALVAALPSVVAVRPNPNVDPLLHSRLLDAMREGVEVYGVGIEYDAPTSHVVLYSSNIPVIP